MTKEYAEHLAAADDAVSSECSETSDYSDKSRQNNQ